MSNRRKFLKALPFLAGAIGYNKAFSEHYDKQDSAFLGKKAITRDLIKPIGIREDSKVGIVAPASGTSMGEVNKGVQFFKSLGCKVEVGNLIKNRTFEYKYLASSDKLRAAELMEFFERKDIDCILCARGGYGVFRMIPYLDFDIIAQNPKIFIGFSDISGLLNAIFVKTGIVTFHGPVASSIYSDFTADHLKKVIVNQEDFEEFRIKSKDYKTIIPGKVKAPLVGGNLSLVASSLGTPYEVDTKDKIVFLEEVFEEPYKIDRMLTHLWTAGKFDNCAGIALGHFGALDAKRNFYPGTSYTIRQVIEDRFKIIGKPALLGLPFGHIKDKVTLPIGIRSELNTEKGTLTILENSVI